ncbi:MAG: ABC transporter substrate-binding protein [Patescibacteria group bacterium]
MAKKLKYLLLGLVVILLGVVAFFSTNRKTPTTPPKNEEVLIPIRVGWQVPWATEGQLVQTLKHTEILKSHGLAGDFKGFDYGGPLNEAALAKQVDVIFTADQPAATLLSKNPNWKIIGRLMYNRVSLYVPPNSPIETSKDLKGKTVAMPFGAAAQRMALNEEELAGLDPKKDVKNINLGIYEQNPLVTDKNAVKWGDIDAMAGFDPVPAVFEERGLVRNLHVGQVISLILMADEYISANPEAPRKFLESFVDAYDYYRSNVTQANQWFREEAKLDVSDVALATSSSVEPNLKVTSKADISIGFSEGDYKTMQEASDFLLAQEMIKTPVNMRNFVDLSYLQK